MTIRTVLRLSAALGAPLGLALGAATAHAAAFTGTATATAAPFLDPTCDPTVSRRGIIPFTNTGTSNLGNFAYSHNVCTAGATGPVQGTFSFDFEGSLLNGLLDGSSVARAGTPGLFDQMFTYTVTDGTGRFAGATGSFINIGTVDVRGGLPSRLQFNLEGDIVPGVPEPESWALLILGFGVAGSALRRSRRQRPVLIAA